VQQQDEQSEHPVGLVQPLHDVSTQPQLAHEDGSLRDNERAKRGVFLNQYGIWLYVATVCGFRTPGSNITDGRGGNRVSLCSASP